MIFGGADLRSFCRAMGVAVTFNGVSTYPDTGELVKGMFDRPVDFKLEDQGIGGIENAAPELRLPYNAFPVMPQSGDTVTVDGTAYTVSQPAAEDDGAFLCYQLYLVSL